MKRFKLFKIVSMLLVVMLMFGSVTAFGALQTAVPDQTTTKVTITGTSTAAKNTPIAIAIYGPDATQAEIDAGLKRVWAAQPDLDATGTYTVEANLAADAQMGTYTVVESIKGFDRTYKTFYFASTQTKLDVIAAIKAAAAANDGAAMKEALDTYKQVLGIIDEYDMFVENVKQKVANEMAANSTLASMPDDVSSMAIAYTGAVKAALVQLLNEGKITNPLDIMKYKNQLGVAAAFTDVFEGAGVTDAGRTLLLSRLTGKNIVNYASLQSMLKEQVLVAGASENTPTGTNAIIVKLGTLSGLTNYADWTKLTDNQKVTVAREIASTKPATVAALDALIGKKIKEFTGNNNGGNGSSGNNNSGTKITFPIQPPPTDEYTDIDHVGWAKDSIYALTNLGIVGGYGDRTFRPDNQITREEFIKMLVVSVYGSNAINPAAKSTFSDAQDGWYAPYVALAEEKGLTKGMGDGTFGVGKPITRQDISLMISRMMIAANYTIDTREVAFTDAGQISEYAKQAVFGLANAGVVNGYSDGSFGPQNSATRAETSVMMGRALVLIGIL